VFVGLLGSDSQFSFFSASLRSDAILRDFGVVIGGYDSTTTSTTESTFFLFVDFKQGYASVGLAEYLAVLHPDTIYNSSVCPWHRGFCHPIALQLEKLTKREPALCMGGHTAGTPPQTELRQNELGLGGFRCSDMCVYVCVSVGVWVFASSENDRLLTFHKSFFPYPPPAHAWSQSCLTRAGARGAPTHLLESNMVFPPALQ